MTRRTWGGAVSRPRRRRAAASQPSAVSSSPLPAAVPPTPAVIPAPVSGVSCCWGWWWVWYGLPTSSCLGCLWFSQWWRNVFWGWGGRQSCCCCCYCGFLFSWPSSPLPSPSFPEESWTPPVSAPGYCWFLSSGGFVSPGYGSVGGRWQCVLLELLQRDLGGYAYMGGTIILEVWPCPAEVWWQSLRRSCCSFPPIWFGLADQCCPCGIGSFWVWGPIPASGPLRLIGSFFPLRVWWRVLRVFSMVGRWPVACWSFEVFRHYFYIDYPDSHPAEVRPADPNFGPALPNIPPTVFSLFVEWKEGGTSLIPQRAPPEWVVGRPLSLPSFCLVLSFICNVVCLSECVVLFSLSLSGCVVLFSLWV